MVLPRNRKNVLCIVLSGNFPSQQISNEHSSAILSSVIFYELTFLFKKCAVYYFYLQYNYL